MNAAVAKRIERLLADWLPDRDDIEIAEALEQISACLDARGPKAPGDVTPSRLKHEDEDIPSITDFWLSQLAIREDYFVVMSRMLDLPVREKLFIRALNATFKYKPIRKTTNLEITRPCYRLPGAIFGEPEVGYEYSLSNFDKEDPEIAPTLRHWARNAARISMELNADPNWILSELFSEVDTFLLKPTVSWQCIVPHNSGKHSRILMSIDPQAEPEEVLSQFRAAKDACGYSGKRANKRRTYFLARLICAAVFVRDFDLMRPDWRDLWEFAHDIWAAKAPEKRNPYPMPPSSKDLHQFARDVRHAVGSLSPLRIGTASRKANKSFTDPHNRVKEE
jgi:hypothetical protein